MDYDAIKLLLDFLQCSDVDTFSMDFHCGDGCVRRLFLETVYNPRFDDIEIIER